MLEAQPDQLKALIKTVLIELLQERPEEIADLFAEIMEDIALAKAIEDGEATPTVSREAIFEILEA
ncbi:MAG: hypothetical protein EDM05_028545 [Leptolyngbya sp. IPPAS B-1204]|nr:MAG: hypothetical protein EDM05_26940 [Leptolyngbya sp. IPPAS B-1204]